MKRLLGSTVAKIAVFLCLCILIPIILGCLVGAIYCYDGGAYDENTGFNNSQICKRYVRSKMAEIKEFIYWNDLAAIPEVEYYYDNTSFAYKIIDAEGKTVIDTTKKGSTLSVDDYVVFEVDSNGNRTVDYTLKGYVNLPVKVGDEIYFYKLLYDVKENLLGITVGLGLVAVVLLIFLLSAAGRTSEGTVELHGLNRCWLDVFFLICGYIVAGMASIFMEIYYYGSGFDDILIMALSAVIATVTALFFLMSTAAHFKIKGWWKHTAVCTVVMAVWHFLKWLVSSLPRMWKLLSAYIVFVTAGFIGCAFLFAEGSFLALLFIIALAGLGIAFMIMLSEQLGKLQKAGEAMVEGDYEYKTDTSAMWFDLKKQAENLNRAADGMSKAVDEKMKSERFKTELITNVSHDLKTPLTSIVSYVDLLKKENIESEKAQEYIEVIDRQSKKLKKLTEDLVEASKASSGAVSVNRDNLNIGELINQSVGEFAERLEAAAITPVINIPEKEVYVFTDGRLLWRVFDNLIQNIVKYAQPGTRAYFDLSVFNGKAVLNIKNISKEQLNMSSEALMERFVQGDSSRKSDGNGLGLSISKSLTELCGGTFSLFLDGDLYKVIITFPLSRKLPVSEIQNEEPKTSENEPVLLPNGE